MDNMTLLSMEAFVV